MVYSACARAYFELISLALVVEFDGIATNKLRDFQVQVHIT
jgi:hypothetical protein